MGDQNEEMFNKIISEPSIIEMNVPCTEYGSYLWPSILEQWLARWSHFHYYRNDCHPYYELYSYDLVSYCTKLVYINIQPIFRRLNKRSMDMQVAWRLLVQKVEPDWLLVYCVPFMLMSSR